MTPDLLRRVRQLRTADPFVPMPVTAAFQQARYELDLDLHGFDFLAGLEESECDVTGTVGAFDVKVAVEYDLDTQLGEDDVTGTFGYKRYPKSIRNTTSGPNGQHFPFYFPANCRLAQDGMPHGKGLSRSRLAEYHRWVVENDMRDDAGRCYLGVIATISLDGKELAEASLWGIDTVDCYDGRPYVIEVAAEMVNEALDQLRQTISKAVDEALAHAERLRSAVATLTR